MLCQTPAPRAGSPFLLNVSDKHNLSLQKRSCNLLSCHERLFGGVYVKTVLGLTWPVYMQMVS
jgi:hypothetical protein